jgi:hypothetical protein
MFKVACFCGCCYSFGDDAGVCPRCGRTAAVSVPSRGLGTGSSQARQETHVLTDGQRTLVLTNLSSGVGECDPPRPGAGDEN